MFQKLRMLLLCLFAVIVMAVPAFATSAGDYTDITSYASTNIPLACLAITGCFGLVLSLALATGVFGKIKGMLHRL